MPEVNTQDAPTPEKLFYLWHLERIGLVDPTRPDPTPDIWKSGLKKIRVAVIDSGCTRRHPNLPGRAVRQPLDVAVAPSGVVYHPVDLENVTRAWQKLPKRLRSILAAIGDADVRQRVADRAAGMAATPPVCLDVPNPANRFSAHGTACAGLIAGRTLRAPADGTVTGAPADPAAADDEEGAAPVGTGATLPYFGVNPFATIIPVTTPYNQEIEPLITALLHAVACEADVILMPRTVNELKPISEASLRHTRFDDDERLKLDKSDFEHLVAAIAADRPVVLAAGNDGEATPAYPASLVKTPHAPTGAEALIVVGAANHLGLRAAYSNGDHATGVTVYAPGDDEETVNTRVQRLDPLRDHGAEIAAALSGITGKTGSGYSPFGVLALDMMHPVRADGSEDQGSAPPRRQLYSLFGGTSAASAIVAGVVSLMQAQADARLTGPVVKQRLSAAPPTTDPALELPPGGPPGRAAFFQVADVLNAPP